MSIYFQLSFVCKITKQEQVLDFVYVKIEKATYAVTVHKSITNKFLL